MFGFLNGKWTPPDKPKPEPGVCSFRFVNFNLIETCDNESMLTYEGRPFCQEHYDRVKVDGIQSDGQ